MSQDSVRSACCRLTESRVCIAAIVQTIFLSEGLAAVDQTRAMMKPVIMQQIVLGLSILTAIVPSLHGFVGNLTAGRFGVEVRDSAAERSIASYGLSRKALRASKAISDRHHGTNTHKSHINSPQTPEASSSLKPDNGCESHAWAQGEGPSGWDESDRRSHGSQENIITQTVTWQVSTNTPPPGRTRADQRAQRLALDGELFDKASARNFVS